jgi:Putative 8-oxoguanine DNA glycosylase OGG-like protein
VAVGPLIADTNTAWSLWALHGTWDSRNDGAQYSAYVAWSERLARLLGCRSDDVERALFALGPDVRRSWRRLRI